LSIAVLALPLAATTTSADAAAPKPKSYANCKALNKVYKHGVARLIPLIKNGKVVKKDGEIVYVKPKDKTSGKPVTTFKVANAVYVRNDGLNSKRFKGDPMAPKDYKGERDLDRDNDGIACEK
jgi:hypothetical protein